MSALDDRKELRRMQRLNFDVVQFDNGLTEWKVDLARNSELATRHYETSLAEIDKAIDHLQKVKTALLQSEKNVRILNDKTAGLTMQRLTANTPSLRALVDSNGNNR